jgi:hypothetical protein
MTTAAMTRTATTPKVTPTMRPMSGPVVITGNAGKVGKFEGNELEGKAVAADPSDPNVVSN